VQADLSTTRKSGGSGLGLAISKHLVEMMHGKLSAVSKFEEGSRFSFTARFRTLDARHIPHERLPAQAEPGSGPDRLNVLLTEDNKVNRVLAKRILEKAGHTVFTASTGQESLDLLAKQSFDVVLMDIQMPEMDGLEATRLIRRSENGSGRHLPIIAMTAHALRGDSNRCIRAGMDGYLSKPFRPEELFDLLRRCVHDPERRPDSGDSESVPHPISPVERI
jgi:CheY-like chemotaxis protein